MVYIAITDNGTLSHVGTKEHSGRRKWGSGKRPYQRLEGTSSWKRMVGKSMAENVRARKIEKKERKVAQRQAKDTVKTKTPRQIDEELKKRSEESVSVKKRGDTITDSSERLKYVYANRKYYSTGEIREAISRYEAEQSLKTAINKSTPPSKMKRIMRGADNMQKELNKTADTAMGWIKGYNKVAAMYNGINSNNIRAGRARAMKPVQLGRAA